MIDIDPEICDGCGVCVNTCPNDAIGLLSGKACVDQELCLECEACIDICPQGAILSVEQARKTEHEIKEPRAIPEATRVEQSSVISSVVGAAITSLLNPNLSARQNLPGKEVGRRQRNGSGQRRGRRQQKGRYKNNGRR